jgi:hypothetical protein
MWTKTEAKTYVNLETGSSLFIQNLAAPVNTSRVQARLPGGQTVTLADGYVDEATAQAAMDELMDAITFVQIQPPVSAMEVENPEA